MALPNLFALAGLLLWAGYEILLRGRDTRTASWRAERGDQLSTYLLIVAYLMAGALAGVMHSVAAGHVHDKWRWIGIVMIALGLLLRAWSMRALGNAYTRTLRTVDGQHVIQAGPYRLIRHPGYAGSLLVWTGFGLGAGNWLAMTGIGVLLLAAYTWRISAEERLLVSAFGDQYTDYRLRTKRLVPFVY